MLSPRHSCFQSTLPSAGADADRAAPFSSRTCATPSIVDEVRRAVAASRRVGPNQRGSRCRRRRRRACRRWRRSPRRRQRAVSSRMPQSGTSLPVSDAALRDHTTEPSRASSALRMPVAPKRVDAAVAEGRRGARTGAGVRLPEPGRVAVPPHRLAGRQLVAGNHLVVAALLLRIEDDRRATANDDQPGPTGRRHSSIGGDLTQSVSIFAPGTTPSRLAPRNPAHSTPGNSRSLGRGAVPVTAAGGATFAAAGAGRGRRWLGVAGYDRRSGRSHFLRNRRGGDGDRLLGQESLFSGPSPTPCEIRRGVARNAVGSNERQRSAAR